MGMASGDDFPRILNASGMGLSPTPLDEAQKLAGYDGILFAPNWQAYHGGVEPYHAPPGEVAYGHSLGEVTRRIRRMEGLTEQCRAFLERGGLLVVRALAPAGLVSPPDVYVDTWAWFMEAIAPQRLATRPDPGAAAEPGPGSDVVVVDEHHPLAPVIRGSGGYDATISDWVVGLDDAHVIAENRAGEPIAVEIPWGRGCVDIVPTSRGLSPETHLLFLRAILLDRPPLAEPATTRELELDDEERQARAQLAGRLDEIGRKRGELGVAKRALFAREHIDRARGHLRRATAPTASERTVMQELYALLEIVVGAVGGGRDEVARTLGIDQSVLTDIGRFSNQSVHGLRHTGDEPLEPLPPGTLERCRKHGVTLLRAYLDWEMGRVAEVE